MCLYIDNEDSLGQKVHFLNAYIEARCYAALDGHIVSFAYVTCTGL